MAIYEITAPNGQTLEIEGDTPPSEAELDEIFAQTKTNSSETNAPKRPTAKGINITPSGLFKGSQNVVASALASPGIAKRDNISIPEAYKQNMEKLKQYRQDNLTPIQDFAIDTAGYLMLPELKGAGIGARALTGLGQGALIGGLEGLKNEASLESVAKGARLGGALGATINSALPPVIKGINQPIRNLIENQKFQNGLAKVLEVLTSVPAKFSKLATAEELAGNSIFNGKFNPETAYAPIGEKVAQAREALPNATDFAGKFYELGKKANQGIESLRNQYGEKLGDVLESMNYRQRNLAPLNKAIETVIDKYGEGGAYNSAIEEAPNVVNYLYNNLGKENLTFRDLDRIKNRLYDMGYAASQNKEGTAADVARKSAEQINNYLRGKANGYGEVNDVLSNIYDVEREVGGLNPNTLSKKISNFGDKANAQVGLDAKLQQLDNVLPNESKFFNEAQQLKNEQNQIEEIKKMVGDKYRKNPRLLANINDTESLNALENLQEKSNVQFMDELDKIRAREALEKWFPGQGGGSGSEQGFGNLLRTSLLGAAPTAALLTHNPAALTGLAAVSPKFMAQGTIKNLGKLYKSLGQKIPESVRRLLTVGALEQLPLQGSISYEEY